MSKGESVDERELKALQQFLRGNGVSVRREKLARGSAFRVRSGACTVFGNNVLFIDKALEPEKQVSVLLDYAFDKQLRFSEDDLESFSTTNRRLIESRQQSVAQ